MQCADDFERRIEIEGPDTVAAIIIEPITAGGGIIVPPPGYLQQVEAIARQYDVKLIVDEVVTGFGRIGEMFACTKLGIRPDIVTMAKGLASGYMPISATAFSQEIFEGFLGGIDSGHHLRHVNTYGGHPVAAAVALANLNVLETEQLARRSEHLGHALLQGFQEAFMGSPYVGDVRGMGLLVGIELVHDRVTKEPISNAAMRSIVQLAMTQGVIIGMATDVEVERNNVLILAPPLVISDTELRQLITVIWESVGTVLNREGAQA